MNELLGLPYSPWSEKAKWALDVRRVPYRFRYFQPLIGEPALRLRLRRPLGRVSVPVLTTDDGRVIADSADIARWADGRGEGPTLFPAGREAEIAALVDFSERAMSAGRALSLTRMLRDPEALAEMVPGPIRRAIGPAAAKVGGMGVARTLRKYDGHREGLEAHRRALDGALGEIRARLASAPDPAAGEPRTLLGRFTFADVAVAQVFAFVEPEATALKLGAASRKTFSDPELRERYADLLAWRDALYRTYRGRGESTGRPS